MKLQPENKVVIGLMSGTSHDGVDAAVARIKDAGPNARVELLRLSRSPYPKALRERVSGAFTGTAKDICGLNFELGEFFAKAALKAMREAGLTPEQVDLIGSHGQTIYHVPPGKGRPASTLQIGEGAVIAARTGVTTVSDFRPADIAAGGQGAPLVPYADWVLFRRPGKTLAVQNIGGIANVTVVPERLEDVIGFDTGPGCSLIDEAVKIISGGENAYDKGGEMAASGKIIPGMLHELLSDPYFRKRPPKSTGRERFGLDMVKKLLKEYRREEKEDILYTLTAFTAESIFIAYGKFVLPRYNLDRVLLAGGGAKNRLLVRLLGEKFAPPVGLTDDFGVPSQAREALCFAVLANETISGRPSNVPGATGARRRAILGKISLGQSIGFEPINRLLTGKPTIPAISRGNR
ncbi:MAG: anhydro-N-acetylmuramic acid kinase [Nitrospirota bacterium]